MRVKSGFATRKRRKQILNRASGYWGHRSNSFRTANQSLYKADQYAFRDRKNKKRTFRRLWIVRINSACRSLGITYSQFINLLKVKNILLNRKALSELAIHNFDLFKKLCQK